VGHRNTVVTDMHTLVEESRLERFCRAALVLGAVPLSVLFFVSL
jgi:hypothetical protein